MLKNYCPESLHRLVASLAETYEVPATDAGRFADALIDAELHGKSTHGVTRLKIYLDRMARGLINPAAELKIEQNGSCILKIDACDGLGQVQAVKALDHMFPLAREHGVVAATFKRSQHFGAVSYYCNLAAQRDMILLAMTNCEPAMSPTGGYEPYFGTNPIGASFPTGKGYAVTIDMATSITARGNIIAAQKEGTAIPSDWALDPQGNATTDPSRALLGTVLTMAGHKGYALALMVELFSSVLSGSAMGDEIGSMYKNLDRPQNVGHFFCLFDISAFIPIDIFRSRIDGMIDRIKANAKRPGIDEIFVPGERSHRNAVKAKLKGVALSATTMQELENLCSQRGVEFQLETASN